MGINRRCFLESSYRLVHLCLKNTIIGIEELQDFIGLEAFPNPAEDVLNVRFDGVDGLADIRVFDLSGQVILSERTRVVPGMVITYGTDEFRPGIYILEVRNGLQRSTLRLTVK